MGAQNATLLIGATITPTGGTVQTFTPDGVFIQNGVHLADAGDASYITRNSITLRTKNPTLTGGVYSKGKRWATLTVPKVLLDGTTAFNIVRIELEVHPETSAGDSTELLKKGAQLFIDTDLAAFWATGSLA